MNILYISRIGNDIAAGLTWSVPAGIKAQSNFDNVFWINQINTQMDHWLKTGVYHSIDELGGKLRLKNIPYPFNHPDIVVFEGFYQLSDVFFSWELTRNSIPYIIIPRGSLTKQSFHNHGWLNFIKKKTACFLIFKPYTKKARAVQYLTKQEYIDSGSNWTNNPIIIPNGFDKPNVIKKYFSKKGLEIVYIGRPTIYHKGLDLLVDACKKIKEYLIIHNTHITLYVPQKNDIDKLKQLITKSNISEILQLKGPIQGKEKEECLLKSDIFIMPSRFEGHPMGLVEALAYGVPVIITPGTNMFEEVKNYDAGWLSSPDPDSLSKTILQAIDEKDSLYIKSKNAIALAEKYEWIKLAQEFHDQISKFDL